MKKIGFIQGAAVALACLGMFVGQVARAAQPLVTDVALAHGGVLKGKIVDRQGAAQAGVPVRVIQGTEVVSATHTDSQGEFAVADLRGGVYQIDTPAGVGVYRFWAPETAPPAANEGVLIVNGENTVQTGQQGGGLLGLLANPWVLALIVAAAIAIPLALDDDDES